NPIEPTRPSRPGSIRAKGAKRVPSSPIASAVPAVAKIAQPHRAENVEAPLAWSLCSCVRKMPSIDSGGICRVSSRLSISRAERPASTRRRVRPDSTTQQLPPEPEARTLTRIERDYSFELSAFSCQLFQADSFARSMSVQSPVQRDRVTRNWRQALWLTAESCELIAIPSPSIRILRRDARWPAAHSLFQNGHAPPEQTPAGQCGRRASTSPDPIRDSPG